MRSTERTPEIIFEEKDTAKFIKRDCTPRTELTHFIIPERMHASYTPLRIVVTLIRKPGIL